MRPARPRTDPQGVSAPKDSPVGRIEVGVAQTLRGEAVNVEAEYDFDAAQPLPNGFQLVRRKLPLELPMP